MADPIIIDEWSSDDEAQESDQKDLNIDPFAEYLNISDSDDEKEQIYEENEVQLNSYASGGIFSEASTAPSSIVGDSSIMDGSSIIGDPAYSSSNSKDPTFIIPAAPDLTAIKNKTLKRKLYHKYLAEKKKLEQVKSKERRKRRLNETEDEIKAKKEHFGKTTAQVDYHQKTIENQRIWDETTVQSLPSIGALSTTEKTVLDPELTLEEQNDEFSEYFKGQVMPKILITTSENARNKTWKLALELGSCIPNSFVLKRKKLAVKKIINQAKNRNFTSIIVINDDRGKPNGLLLSHLPTGPTALFKLSNFKLRCELNKKNTRGCKGKGNVQQQPSCHRPELILKRFGTRLGHRVSRLFASLYPHDPQFKGRQVATIYNQRDYIFFRMHRYQFAKLGKKVNLLEMGPRFTLKLRSLQLGTFDSKFGDYEWIAKRHSQDTSRRKFHL